VFHAVSRNTPGFHGHFGSQILVPEFKMSDRPYLAALDAVLLWSWRREYRPANTEKIKINCCQYLYMHAQHLCVM